MSVNEKQIPKSLAHHSSLGSSLLGLEENRFLFTALRTGLVDSRQLKHGR
jgi:hypothetical protein